MIVQAIFISLITLLIMCILLYPSVCVAGAANGLMIWLESALPSLFPFMVLTGLLTRITVPVFPSTKSNLSRSAIKSMFTFIYAAVIGLLSGYPMGVRTIRELRETGQLNQKQAAVLLGFVNQPGPMFILGYALPHCHLSKEMTQRFLSAFYGGILLVALCNGIFLLFQNNISLSRRQRDHSIYHIVVSPVTREKQTSFFPMFEETILTSMITLVKIGGYMMLFSLIYALMETLIPLSLAPRLILGGLLEMTAGIAATGSSGFPYTPHLILIFLSFGGLCVTTQSFTLGALTQKEQLHYLFCKLIQTGFTICLYEIMTVYLPR